MRRSANRIAYSLVRPSYFVAERRRRFVSMKLRVSRRFVEDGASEYRVSGLFMDDETSELQGSRLRFGVHGSIHGGSLSMEDWVR
uniref:Uncharacterized protein n=1 Tax=Cannabis sativa TaxID=3483 RepID=A0A803PWW6_CANSA